MEDLEERWNNKKETCDSLLPRVKEKDRLELCRIGNRVAKAIGKRCMEGDESDFTVDLSRQATSIEQVGKFLDLLFGNIWEVDTHANCKKDFDIVRVPGKLAVKIVHGD